MRGFNKIIATFFLIMPLHIYAENCDSLKTTITKWNTQILEENNQIDYKSIKEKYGEIKSWISNSDCSKESKDSLRVEVSAIFAFNGASKYGDLSEYQRTLLAISEICDQYPDSLNIEESLKNHFLAYKGICEERISVLKENYASLVIAMKSNREKNEMGIVINKNNINSGKPISIKITPPLAIRGDDIKYQRLEYISQNFRLDFTDYDARIGFVKKIPFLPLPSRLERKEYGDEIFKTYAFTFDDSIRYRHPVNRKGSFDTLYIEPIHDWVLINQVPDAITVINMPKNLKYTIKNSNTDNTREDLRIKENNQVIIRKDIDKDIQIIFEEEGKRTNRYFYVLLRGLAVGLLILAPIIIF